MAYSREQIILKNEKSLNVDSIIMKSNKIIIDRDKKLPDSAVKEIYFNVKPKKEKKSEFVHNPNKDIKKIISEVKEYASKYPNAAFVTTIDDGVYEYHKDGTSEYTYHMRGMIMKDVAKRYSTGGAYFVEGRDKVELIMARTIRPDGMVINFNKKNVMISKPGGRGDAFTAGSTYIFKLPEAEVGSIIEYIYKKTTYNPGKKEFFFPQYMFQSTEPVKESKCKVIIPKDMTLYYSAKNFPGGKNKPDITVENGKKIYTWDVLDPPLIVSEPSMPAINDVAASMYGAIFKDWNIIFDWLEDYYSKNCIPSYELSEFTKELVKDCNTDEEKVAKIYHWIQQNIRYIIIKGDLSSTFGSYKCDTIFERKFGCCVDKAVLFSGMLNAVNIKSTPVVLNTTLGDDIDPNVPRIYLQHAINCVYLNGNRIFLDSTGYNSRFPSFSVGDQGVWCLNPMEKELQWIPQQKPEEVSAGYRYSIKMNKRGDCSVKMWTKYNGSYESWIRGYWKGVKESERKRIFQSMISRIAPGARIKNYKLYNLNDISKPFSLMEDFDILSYPTFASDLVIFAIPDLKYNFPELSLEKRKYPLEYQMPIMRQHMYNIEIPKNMKIMYLPKPLDINEKYFSYHAEFKKINEHKIIFSDIYKRRCRYVQPSEYERFRRLHLDIVDYSQKKIFLRNFGGDK